jgi:Bacterial Ig-like domain (group 2)
MRSYAKFFAPVYLLVLGCGGGASSTGPSTLSVSVPTSPIQSGTSVQAVATTIDASGRSSPASNVTWSTSNKDVLAVSATGVLTAAKVGSATITARSGDLVGQVNVGVTPGAPASIQIVSGSGQTAVHGATLPDPLCTTVLDAAGNFLSGITVTYVVASGGGSVASPTSPATDGGGIAISGHWTLGPGTGQQTVTATASVGSVTFTANSQ